MIGIIPGKTKTFVVAGMLDDNSLEEGKLYVDNKTGRIFMYSLTETRANPTTGFFPIYDGKKKYISKFANEKYIDKDVINTDIKHLSSEINTEVADNILYLQRRADNGDVLKPEIQVNDNMFTQCIKGIFDIKDLTLVDLIDLSGLNEKLISGYYSALSKIAFMRAERWHVWIDKIFKIDYNIYVLKDDEPILSYTHSTKTYDIVDKTKYSDIINGKDDFLKKIVKIIMQLENINKDDLKSDQVDDYTVNNMMIILGNNKPLSSQLFSRFITMANLSYRVVLYENSTQIFEFSE